MTKNIEIHLKNKIALITGAGRGIGKAIALKFAKAGAAVVINDINTENMKQVVEEIKQNGGKVIYKKADVSDSKEVKELVDFANQKLGTIDILVNNAAISKIVSFLDTTEEEWDRVIEVNLKGAFLCSKAVLPGMIKKREGKIINISSQSGRRGSPWHAAYSASKFGIIGLTQSLAVEFAPYNIKVNAICPGVVFTPLWEEMIDDYAQKLGIKKEKVKDYLISKIPLGRLGTTEDVANLALFLASSYSDYITGQAINVSGGSVL